MPAGGSKTAAKKPVRIHPAYPRGCHRHLPRPPLRATPKARRYGRGVPPMHYADKLLTPSSKGGRDSKRKRVWIGSELTLSALGESYFYFVPGAAMRPFGLSLSMMIKIAILLEERGRPFRVLGFHRLVDDQRPSRFNTRDSV